MVREIGDLTLRELLVFDYRLLYRVREDRVIIQAFSTAPVTFRNGGASKHRNCEPRRLTAAAPVGGRARIV